MNDALRTLQPRQAALWEFLQTLPQRVLEVLPLPLEARLQGADTAGSLTNTPAMQGILNLCFALNSVCIEEYMQRKVLFLLDSRIRPSLHPFQQVIPLGIEIRSHRKKQIGLDESQAGPVNANPVNADPVNADPVNTNRAGLTAVLSVPNTAQPMLLLIRNLLEDTDLQTYWGPMKNAGTRTALRTADGELPYAVPKGRIPEPLHRLTRDCLEARSRQEFPKDTKGWSWPGIAEQSCGISFEDGILRIPHRDSRRWESIPERHLRTRGNYRGEEDEKHGEFRTLHATLRVEADGSVHPGPAYGTGAGFPLKLTGRLPSPAQKIKRLAFHLSKTTIRSQGHPDQVRKEWHNRNRESLTALREALRKDVLQFLRSCGQNTLRGYLIAFPAFQAGLQVRHATGSMARLLARKAQDTSIHWKDAAQEFLKAASVQTQAQTQAQTRTQPQTGTKALRKSAQLHQSMPGTGETFLQWKTRLTGKIEKRRERYRTGSALCALRDADPAGFEAEANRDAEALMHTARNLSGGGRELAQNDPAASIVLDPDCADFSFTVHEGEFGNVRLNGVLFDSALARCLRKAGAWNWKQPQGYETILCALRVLAQYFIAVPQDYTNSYDWWSSDGLESALLSAWLCQNPADGRQLEEWAQAFAESDTGRRNGMNLPLPIPINSGPGSGSGLGLRMTGSGGEILQWIRHAQQGLFAGRNSRPGGKSWQQVLLEGDRNRRWIYPLHSANPDGTDPVLFGFQQAGRPGKPPALEIRGVEPGKPGMDYTEWNSGTTVPPGAACGVIRELSDCLGWKRKRPLADLAEEAAGKVKASCSGPVPALRPLPSPPEERSDEFRALQDLPWPESLRTLLQACFGRHPLLHGHRRLKEAPMWRIQCRQRELRKAERKAWEAYQETNETECFPGYRNPGRWENLPENVEEGS